MLASCELGPPWLQRLACASPKGRFLLAVGRRHQPHPLLRTHFKHPEPPGLVVAAPFVFFVFLEGLALHCCSNQLTDITPARQHQQHRKARRHLSASVPDRLPDDLVAARAGRPQPRGAHTHTLVHTLLRKRRQPRILPRACTEPDQPRAARTPPKAILVHQPAPRRL